MQPKFTRKNLGYLCLRITAMALVLLSATQVSFAQRSGRSRTSPAQTGNVKASQISYDQRVQQKWRNYEQRQGAARVNNDAGLPSRQAGTVVNSPEAICQTFNGDFAGAPTMANRLFRPGATSSCTVPYAFPGTFAQTVPFRTFTYTNTTGLTQCGTFTLSTVGGGSNAQFGIWNGSFNPAALATNYLADPGVSGVGAPTSCQGTIASGQTIVFAVFDLGTPATSFSLTVDFPICFSAPCAGVPAPGNTLSTVTTVCPGINFTLSLQNSTIGSGVSYQWQTAATAAGPWSNAGPNAPVWTTSQGAATCYRCIVTCSSPGGRAGP